jgi:hypothetical protein
MGGLGGMAGDMMVKGFSAVHGEEVEEEHKVEEREKEEEKVWLHCVVGAKVDKAEKTAESGEDEGDAETGSEGVDGPVSLGPRWSAATCPVMLTFRHLFLVPKLFTSSYYVYLSQQPRLSLDVEDSTRSSMQVYQRMRWLTCEDNSMRGEVKRFLMGWIRVSLRATAGERKKVVWELIR